VPSKTYMRETEMPKILLKNETPEFGLPEYLPLII